ncbi:MAG TPA: HipA family kinase [Thermomicrobiales bacterium]|nr:HipA family kinase [Thermomicrobiales bacterium]
MNDTHRTTIDQGDGVVRTVTATRYVTPLREGGSLPAIAEADDDGMYVVKFRGAAQGTRALIAELIAGGIGHALGLPVPELVLVLIDPEFGRAEPHQEIQGLIERSVGLNVGLDYLPGSITFDPVARPAPDPDLAARIVWFDALVTNVDRTVRNTNLLRWHRALWLIDHGAAMYFHHTWHDPATLARTPFARVADHVLLPYASPIPDAAAILRPMLDRDRLAAILDAIPPEWLGAEAGFASADEHRAAYLDYFLARLEASAVFTEEAERARIAVQPL